MANNTIRLTFDCSEDLHTVAKARSLMNKQTLKDYLVGLIAKDAVSDTEHKFADKRQFEKELRYSKDKDRELMKGLSNR